MATPGFISPISKVSQDPLDDPATFILGLDSPDSCSWGFAVYNEDTGEPKLTSNACISEEVINTFEPGNYVVRVGKIAEGASGTGVLIISVGKLEQGWESINWRWFSKDEELIAEDLGMAGSALVRKSDVEPFFRGETVGKVLFSYIFET